SFSRRLTSSATIRQSLCMFSDIEGTVVASRTSGDCPGERARARASGRRRRRTRRGPRPLPSRAQARRSPCSRVRPMDDGAIRCIECKLEVDEYTAIAKGWRYWSDGDSLLPYCPECAKREFAPDAPARGLVPLVHRLTD